MIHTPFLANVGGYHGTCTLVTYLYDFESNRRAAGDIIVVALPHSSDAGAFMETLEHPWVSRILMHPCRV
jgi:hypothetical protein